MGMNIESMRMGLSTEGIGMSKRMDMGRALEEWVWV